MKFSFSDTAEKAKKEYGIGGGNTFKIKEGENKVRLVSECVPHQSEYQGKKTFKWLCYVIDRTDNTLKTYYMPNSIYKQIGALQSSQDYAFDEIPMPYDLIIMARNAGTIDVEYSTMGARKEAPLSEKELAEIAQATPIAEVAKKLQGKEYQEKANPRDETDSLEEIPF